jgi:hypothetical protein
MKKNIISFAIFAEPEPQYGVAPASTTLLQMLSKQCFRGRSAALALL